jgi:LAGLIDADG-like domain
MMQRQIPSLEASTAAYFAGLFDGEGYITVSVPRDRNTAVLIIGLGSTDVPVVDELHRIFGGCLTAIRVSSRISRKPSREWKTTNDGAAAFLKTVFPHLRIKKRQAALAFKFRKVMSQTFRSKDVYRHELLKRLAREIRDLNRGLLPDVETVKGTPARLEKSQSIAPAQSRLFAGDGES